MSTTTLDDQIYNFILNTENLNSTSTDSPIILRDISLLSSINTDSTTQTSPLYCYLDTLDNQYVPIFDHVFLTDNNNCNVASSIIGQDNVTFTQDLRFYLKQCIGNATGSSSTLCTDVTNFITNAHNKKKKVVAFCIDPKPCISQAVYINIVSKFANVLRQVINLNCSILMVPNNAVVSTNLYKDIYTILANSISNYTTGYRQQIDFLIVTPGHIDMYFFNNLYNMIDFSVIMDTTQLIYSIMYNVPFVCLIDDPNSETSNMINRFNLSNYCTVIYTTSINASSIKNTNTLVNKMKRTAVSSNVTLYTSRRLSYHQQYHKYQKQQAQKGQQKPQITYPHPQTNNIQKPSSAVSGSGKVPTQTVPLITPETQVVVTGFDDKDLIRLIKNGMANLNIIQSNLYSLYNTVILPPLISAITLLQYLYVNDIVRNTAPKTISQQSVTQHISTLTTNIVNYCHLNFTPNILSNSENSDICLSTYVQSDPTIDVDTLAGLLCYTINADPFNQFHHLIVSKLKSTDPNNQYYLTATTTALINEYYQDYYLGYPSAGQSAPNKILNFKFYNQYDWQAVHRSGWQYVVEQFYPNFQATNNIVASSALFDTYIDRTFLWGDKVMSALNITPYSQCTKKWIGVMHHAPTGTKYSANNILTNQNFINSLSNCAGIYTLSNYMKTWLENNINTGIKVNMFYHPAEPVTNEQMFNFNNFVNNPNKLVIQVGSFLRNMFAIYALNLGSNTVGLTKAILNSSSYAPTIPDEDFDFATYVNTILTQDGYNLSGQQYSICPLNICPYNPTLCPTGVNLGTFFDDMATFLNIDNLANISNTFNQQANRIYDSVTVIGELSNTEYDNFLTENIVMINLIDASASNTIIECIMRNTPILVNKLDAVVEYLGEDYPFYYDTFDEAAEKLNDIDQIRAAYDYLSNKDKSFLSVNNVVASIVASDIFNSLNIQPLSS